MPIERVLKYQSALPCMYLLLGCVRRAAFAREKGTDRRDSGGPHGTVLLERFPLHALSWDPSFSCRCDVKPRLILLASSDCMWGRMHRPRMILFVVLLIAAIWIVVGASW